MINIHEEEFFLSIIFFIALGIQIFYYLFFYLRITFNKTKNVTAANKGISVIICAKNEAENLDKFLEKFLTQNYENYEVIVVNDNSRDNTVQVLSKYREKYDKLYYTNLDNEGEFIHGKKLALTIGIKAAKNNILVLSDADCYPESDNWLSEIAGAYTNEKNELVIAYGGYNTTAGFLNKIIRYETMFIAMQYMTFAKAGIVYMATGRNLSYTKSLYHKVKGFSSHYHVISGDDDLFVNSAAKKNNTAVICTPESFTRSLPKQSFSEFITQKRRHLTTGKYYKFSHKIVLGTEITTRLLLYLSFAVLAVTSPNALYFLYLFLFRFILQLIIVSAAAKKFNEKGLFFLIPVFDILLLLINIWVAFTNIIINRRKKRVWK